MFLLTGILGQVVGLLTGYGTAGIAVLGPVRVKFADIINNTVEFLAFIRVQHKILVTQYDVVAARLLQKQIHPGIGIVLVGSSIIDIQELAVRFGEAGFTKRRQRIGILRLVREQGT